ncbi:PAS domain-containing sensor histidine kinase [Megalodesulfovibrio paquesii]
MPQGSDSSIHPHEMAPRAGTRCARQERPASSPPLRPDSQDDARDSQLHEHLRALERFRCLLDQVQDAIFLLDPETMAVIDCNQAACAMTGLDKHNLLQRGLCELMAPEDGAQLLGMPQNRQTSMLCRVSCDTVPPLPVDVRFQLQTFEGRPYGVAIARDASERMAVETKLNASLKEKELLLREVHHRVKNNLQVVSSFLSVQSHFFKDPDDVALLKESQNRIRTIASVHERLYGSDDLATVNFCEYMEDLATHLAQVYRVRGRTLNVKVTHCAIGLTIEKAIPCGLIINELVTNAMIHAFAGRDHGTVLLSFLPSDVGTALLTVTDDGVGLPTSLDITQTDSLGFVIVRLLTCQLKGTLRVTTRPIAPGTRFEIELPAGVASALQYS